MAHPVARSNSSMPMSKLSTIMAAEYLPSVMGSSLSFRHDEEVALPVGPRRERVVRSSGRLRRYDGFLRIGVAAVARAPTAVVLPVCDVQVVRRAVEHAYLPDRFTFDLAVVLCIGSDVDPRVVLTRVMRPAARVAPVERALIALAAGSRRELHLAVEAAALMVVDDERLVEAEPDESGLRCVGGDAVDGDLQR